MRLKQIKKMEDIVIQQERFNKTFKSAEGCLKEKLAEKQKIEGLPLSSFIPVNLYEKRIRNPETFKIKFKTNDLDKKILYFTKHIFCKYKTPKFFDKLLNQKDFGSSKNIDYYDWFICLATGGSLYKEHFKYMLTKKETHAFSNCPHEEFNVKEALVYGVAFAESNNVGISKRIALSNLSKKDITLDFWKNCIKFFANTERVPDSISKLNDLIDYLNHEFTMDRNFNIFGSGYTLVSLNKRMIDWHHQLRRVREFGNFTWEGHSHQGLFFVRNEGKLNEEIYQIKQITTSKELLEEGRSQHHCVFSYKQSCINGVCSIWSLTLNGKRKVTIEVVNKRIVQAKGFANRITTSQEDFIINKWCESAAISYNVRY